ncbi:MAG TPA: hypothetical protein HA222_02170, partial [Candidatus Diapherotrites archaeon]|nr:hypothetical protein [Candidatus Diapherotrites archaeon]
MRKEYYLKNIKEAVVAIKNSIGSDGCLCVPFQKKQVKIANSRWQEGALTLAWAQERLKQDLALEIEKALLFWNGLQNPDGSFPEQDRKSYAATAFSSLAVAKALKLCEKRISSKVFEECVEALANAKGFLEENSNQGKTNQEIAAVSALEEMREFVKVDGKAVERKKTLAFENQTPSGFFKEDEGVDLGYASLSWEMLELLGFRKDAEKFVETLAHFVFPDGTICANFSRTIGWVVLDQLEMLAAKNPLAERILNLYIQADLKGLHSARHFLDLRHTMTDAYRLCSALDNCKGERKPKAEMPFERLDWSREFPERILVVRKPRHMSVFYLQKKFAYSCWFKKGMVANLSSNLEGSTVIEKHFVTESPEMLEFEKRENSLRAWGICRP